MKKHALYLKFMEDKFDTIIKWYNLLDSISPNLFNIYVWIESKKDPKEIIKKYNLKKYKNKSHIYFITHFNKKEFCYNIDEKENIVTEFIRQFGPYFFMKAHCQAHLKTFFLTKEKYIINLDADDIFYDNLTQNHLLRVIDYLNKTKLMIITRPFHAHQNCWSWGFTVSHRDVIKNLDLFMKRDFHKLCKKSIEILGKRWWTNDSKLKINLDHYFDLLLRVEKKIPEKNLFFGFKDFKWKDNNWNKNAIIIEQEFLRKHKCPLL